MGQRLLIIAILAKVLYLRHERINCLSLIYLHSRLAQAAILLHLPVIRAHSRDGVEEVVGVVLVLDSLELGVVGAVEDVLPVGLAEVGFVEVRSAVGRQLGEFGHEHVGHEVLFVEHLLPRGGEVPGRRDDRVDDGLAPDGVDGVFRVAGCGERSVEGDADELRALLVDEAVCVGQSGVVVFDDGAGDEAAAVLGNADLDGGEHVVEEGQVAVELAEEAVVLDLKLIELVHQGSESLLQLVDGDVGTGERRNGEGLVGEVPHAHDARVG